MDDLGFFLTFAMFQSENDKNVTVGELASIMRISRQQVHNRLNSLIIRKLIIRVKRGQYRLADSRFNRAVGLCVLLPMDVYEYQSHIELERRSAQAS